MAESPESVDMWITLAKSTGKLSPNQTFPRVFHVKKRLFPIYPQSYPQSFPPESQKKLPVQTSFSWEEWTILLVKPISAKDVEFFFCKNAFNSLVKRNTPDPWGGKRVW